MHKEWKGTLPQHEICRVILTETGFRSIRYINRNFEMDSDKREEQIKLLKDSASVVSIEEAANSNGLSMIEKLCDSLDLGSIFNEWQVKSIFPTEGLRLQQPRACPGYIQNKYCNLKGYN